MNDPYDNARDDAAMLARHGRATAREPLYDVTLVEVATRYVGETPVQCAVFHKRDGTAVVVRLTSSQMTDAAAKLQQKVADEGQVWP